jgi:hypothetical protein
MLNLNIHNVVSVVVTPTREMRSQTGAFTTSEVVITDDTGAQLIINLFHKEVEEKS